MNRDLGRAARAIRSGAARLVAALACAACVMATALMAGGAGLPAAQSAGGASATRWKDRLLALDPLRPLDYLELGEEIADTAIDESDRDLARQLFGFAGALDPERLGRSAMLALAALAGDATERARAMAAAELVGGKGVVREALRVEPAQLEALARSFSYHRRGDGRRAQTALRQNGADALLELVGPRLPGGAQGYRDECAAMRASGVSLAEPEMVRRQFEIELALRRGELRALSLDAALRGDSPLVEIDLGDPKALWGVDPSRPWWRDGIWRSNG
jgi:hypothetical protein